MDINNSYQYYVVEFSDPPHTGFDKYVCVPVSWMGLHDEETQTAVIKYPKEEMSVTEKRVKNTEIFLRDWPIFEVYVKFGADTYRNAKNYIKLLHNVLLVTQGVENIDLKIKTPETKLKKFLVDPNSKEHNTTTNSLNLLKQEQSETKCTENSNTTNKPPVSRDLDLTNESPSELSQKHLLNSDLLKELKKMDSTIELSCKNIEHSLHEYKKQSMLIKTMIRSVENFDAIFNDCIADISHSTIEASVNDENTVIFNDLEKVANVANKIAKDSEDKETDVIKHDDDDFIHKIARKNDDKRKDRGTKHDNNGQARTGNFLLKKRPRNTSSGSYYDDDPPQRNLENHQELKNLFKLAPDSNLHVKSIQFSNCKKISKDSFYRFFY